jgi:hypothetical protein
MKNAFFIGLTLSVAVLFAACKEEEPERSGEIVIGEYEGMKIQHHDTILAGGYHQKAGYTIDIDLDGQDDLTLISNIWGSPGMGQHPEADISSLNKSLGIHGIVFQDTTFYYHKIDTFYYSKVEIYIRNRYSCRREHPEDQVNRIRENFQPRAMKRGERLNRADFFLSDTSLSLNYSSYWQWRELLSTSDTLIVDGYYAFYDCHTFPDDEICWVGLRKETPDGIKLGWLKIIISGHYKISILESAIQE